MSTIYNEDRDRGRDTNMYIRLDHQGELGKMPARARNQARASAKRDGSERSSEVLSEVLRGHRGTSLGHRSTSLRVGNEMKG